MKVKRGKLIVSRRLVLVLAVFCMGIGAVSASGDEIGETEPDARQVSAGVLILGEDPVGSGYFVARGPGAINPESDEDWWSFEAQAGDVVAVAVDVRDEDNRVSTYPGATRRAFH
jgi:hypothetical protein